MILLPVETWRQIIKTHLDTNDWLALATTSSFFHLISQEALYEAICLSRTEDEVNPELELFARSLKERPALALLVRRLSIWYEYIGHKDPPQIFDYYEDHPILSNLHLFSTLTYLHVAFFLIDPPFLSAIRSHPRLFHIKFTFCKVWEAIASINRSSLATPISGMVADNPQSSSHRNPSSIRFLEFECGNGMLAAQAFTVLQVLGVTQTPTGLSIWMPRAPLPAILTGLALFSQLRHLTLPGGQFSKTAEPSPFDLLTFHSVPLLEEFTGPAECLGKLIPGRPVHTVTIWFEEDTPVDVLLVLKQSAVPVTKLIISGRRDGMQRDHKYLMHAPTSIASFGWDDDMSYKHAELCCPALSRLTSLAVVRGCTTGTTEHEIRSHRTDIVNKLSNACPSIKEFDFWTERWLARKDGSWERYL